jgi:glycosyltransferase involved in cell wall biosynthesis
MDNIQRKTSPLRMLFVAPYIPYPPYSGSSIRIYNLMRHLARQHSVTCIGFESPFGGGGASQLKRLGICARALPTPPRLQGAYLARATVNLLLRGRSLLEQRYWSTDLARHVREITSHSPHDVVQFELLQMGAYLPQACSGLRVLVEHDAMFLTFERMAMASGPVRAFVARREARRLRALTRRYAQQADCCVAVSEADQRVLQEVAGRPFVVIPNGVDLQAFAPMPHCAGPPAVVFSANMNWAPNAEACQWLVREIMPAVWARCPDVRCDLVGSTPPPRVSRLAGPRVRVTGTVPDTRPYLAAASVVVVPIRWGTGTRLKILEGLAMRRPVVSTTVGAEGLNLHPGLDYVLADDAEEFARAVVALLNDPALAERLAEHGHQTVAAQYDWSVIAAALERLYYEARQ